MVEEIKKARFIDTNLANYEQQFLERIDEKIKQHPEVEYFRYCRGCMVHAIGGIDNYEKALK